MAACWLGRHDMQTGLRIMARVSAGLWDEDVKLRPWTREGAAYGSGKQLANEAFRRLAAQRAQRRAAASPPRQQRLCAAQAAWFVATGG